MANSTRGRPYGSVGRRRSAVPARAPLPTTQDRAAWLLRVNRLYGREPRWAKGDSFARSFHGGSWPAQVSVSSISRWETGVTRVGHSAVRRYEQLLGLPPGQLTATIDILHRYAAPSAGAVPLLARAPGDLGAAERRVDTLLDRALDDAPVTGADWDELTVLLVLHPQLRLRSRDWTALAERLLTESLVSDGLAWQQRHEALNRVLGHPSGQVAAVSACIAWAADAHNQVFLEPVCLLDSSAHPDAASGVLAQLARPTNDSAFLGALLACVRKVRLQHFDRPQSAVLARLVKQVAYDADGRQAEERALAAVVSRMLDGAPPSLPARTRTGAGERYGSDIAARVTASALSAVSREIPRFTDPLLPLLVREMLLHPVFDMRLYAAMMVAATPYRAPVAAAMSYELSRLAVARDVTLAGRLLEALRIVGGTAERPLVQRLALAPTLPEAVVRAATSALAHMGGVSPRSFWENALALTPAAGGASRPAGGRAASAAVYGLGISGETDLLRRVSGDLRIPSKTRAAASWWLRLPSRVRAGGAAKRA
ncbi:XRE family transcriptional regulator [Streptomyces sp. NPDC008079]|uniref:XRE family transcriptional regulator n=1 Tax=unclassified Streptomyces TaxID=2593676 RepID=UPI0036EFDE06